MGGISGGSSKSSSKPKLLPEQQAVYRYMFSDIFPQSRGQDTFLTNIMAQNARDEGAAMQNQQMQMAQNQMAAAGGGGASMAGLLKQINDEALKNTFKQITQQRQATALNALSMIAGLPLTAGQKSSSSSVQGGVSVGSSKRFKHNIRDMHADWEQALGLRPVRFEYNDDPGTAQIGYIAEELDELGLNDLVVYDSMGRPEAINYAFIAIYAIELIKDLNKRVQALEGGER